MRWIPALQNQLAFLIDVGRSEAHLQVVNGIVVYIFTQL